MRPWILLSLTFVLGIGSALANHAWQSTLPELVERKELSAAIALNSIQFNLARAIGPAIGGMLVAAIGAGHSFLINAAFFVVVVAVLFAWAPRGRAFDSSRRKVSRGAEGREFVIPAIPRE